MKKQNKNERVRGVLVSMVNAKVLTEKLIEIGCSESSLKGKSPDLKLEVFMEWSTDKLKALKESGNDEAYGQCEECGAPCDLSWTQCAVCGTGNDEVEPPPKEDVEEESTTIVETGREVELDEAVIRIKQYFAGSMSTYWNLGRELLSVFDNKLYLKRTNTSGSPAYTSWDQFIEAEIGMSGARARTVMVVAREFTEEQVMSLGVEKLRTIASLPENRREEFIDQAPKMSTRELARAAVGVRTTTPQPRVTPPAEKAGLTQGTEAAKKARDRKEAVKAGNAVTAVFQQGEFEIPLKLVGKDYTATHLLVNGVLCTFTIHVTGKRRFMHLKIDRSAPTGEDEFEP